MPGPRRRRAGAAGDPELTPAPASDQPLEPALWTLPKGTLLHRIYLPASFGATPLGFRTHGPHNRFDHQVPDADGQACENPGRGILYAGYGLRCALGEIFTDLGAVELRGAHIATIYPTRHLTLIDLRGPAATGVGTTQAISAISQRATSQSWGRYLYEHSELQTIDGLIYTASNSGDDAVALYERCQGSLKERISMPLGDDRISGELQVAADQLHWAIHG